MSDVKSYADKSKKLATKSVLILTQHRFVLIFVILGAAISLALFRTQSYIDIPRNEDRFVEGKLTINYKEIDTKTLESFRSKLNDQNIQVDSQFDPNRSNPFIDN